MKLLWMDRTCLQLVKYLFSAGLLNLLVFENKGELELNVVLGTFTRLMSLFISHRNIIFASPALLTESGKWSGKDVWLLIQVLEEKLTLQVSYLRMYFRSVDAMCVK